MFASLFAGLSTLLVTLDLSALTNISGADGLFFYANIVLTALAPIALIGIGFTLGKQILTFLQRVFSNLL